MRLETFEMTLMRTEALGDGITAEIERMGHDQKREDRGTLQMIGCKGAGAGKATVTPWGQFCG